MHAWGKDVLLTRRGLIAGAAGLLVARPAQAAPAPTPAFTAGPFYPGVKPADTDADLTVLEGSSRRAEGEVIEVAGRVLSVKGGALRDAVVEIWQADSRGRYNFPSEPGAARFQGFGAVRSGNDGAFRFRTIRPRHYASRTPHIHFRVVSAAGRELVTQMFFPGEPMNAGDFLYARLPDDAARAAATARADRAGEVPRYLFDVVIA